MTYHAQWNNALGMLRWRQQQKRDNIRDYMRRECTEQAYQARAQVIDMMIDNIEREMEKIRPFVIKENRGEL